MSTTGTRPPLFDPEPGSFDDDVDAPLFPHRPGGGRRGGGRPAQDDSPRWVRPFLLGGLVLVALLSLFAFLGDGAGDPPPGALPADDVAADVADDPAADDPAAGDPAAGDGAQDADAVGDLPADAGLSPATGPVEEDPSLAGGTAAITSTPDASAATPAADGRAGTPGLPAAEAFAAQFAHDYLNLDEANPQIRQRALAAYLAPGLDPQLGWDGTGTQVAVLTIPVQTRADGDAVTVTVAAQVTGREAPRWVHLAVPLAQDDRDRWAVVAPPAYVARPRAGTPEVATAGEVDDDLSTALQPTVRTMFGAFATDEVVQLDGITAEASDIRGLDGQVELVEVGAVRAVEGDGSRRLAEVDVTWRDEVTGTTVGQRYEITVVEVDGSWLIEAVGTS